MGLIKIINNYKNRDMKTIKKYFPYIILGVIILGAIVGVLNEIFIWWVW